MELLEPRHGQMRWRRGAAGDEDSSEGEDTRSNTHGAGRNDAARVRLTYSRARSGPPSGPLVHTHIVHPHGLREYGRGVWITGPVPADGDVQNDEERVIEHPLSGYIPRRSGLVERVVDVPSNRA